MQMLNPAHYYTSRLFLSRERVQNYTKSDLFFSLVQTIHKHTTPTAAQMIQSFL